MAIDQRPELARQRLASAGVELGERLLEADSQPRLADAAGRLQEIARPSHLGLRPARFVALGLGPQKLGVERRQVAERGVEMPLLDAGQLQRAAPPARRRNRKAPTSYAADKPSSR